MRYFLLALFILLNNQLSAQHLDWAKNVSNYGSNPGNGVAVDHSGNVYVTGLNYLAIKYNSAGSIIWADSIQAAGSSICVDSFGNSYITGTFGGTRDFDPGAGIVNLTATSTSAFIEKIDSAGNFVWVKQISGNDAVISNKIVRNNFGEMYITGHFKGTADFDPGPSTSNLLSQSDFDIFIVKLDAAGNLIWAKSVGGPGNDQSLSVALDNNNDVIATGVF
jgi:arginine repressor